MITCENLPLYFPDVFRRRTLIVACLLPAIAAAFQAVAMPVLRLQLGSIDYRGMTISGLQLEMAPGGGPGTLRISADRLAAGNGTVLKNLQLVCTDGDFSEKEVRCDGASLKAVIPGGGLISGRLAVHYAFDGSAADLRILNLKYPTGRINGDWTARPGVWQAQVHATGVALSWIRGPATAAGLWPVGYSDPGGQVDLDLSMAGKGTEIRRANGRLQTRAIGIYGPSSAEKLSSQLSFQVDRTKGLNVSASGELDSGLMYIQPGITMGDIQPGIAIEVPATPVKFDADFQWDADSHELQIKHLDLMHPGVVNAHLGGDFSFSDGPRIHSMDMTVKGADAGKLYTTYLQPFLLNTGFGSMEAAGSVDAGVAIRDQRLETLGIRFHDVHAYDDNNRFSVAGLDGDVEVHSGPTPVLSNLHWSAIGIYRLNFGRGRLELKSSNSDVQVVSWADVPLLDGALKISALSVANAGHRNMRIDLDGSITPVSMTELTQTLGLPVMSGKLTSAIRGLHYQYGDLTLDGDIRIGLFGGAVDVSNLSVKDLFGLVPVLDADVDIRNIDLKLLTDRFSFGSISGTLDGGVHDLVLQDWHPVSFRAKLETPRDDPSSHRISQRAVDNLGFIGGGATGALSGGLLRFFKEYSYGRLGIGCRLYNGVCEMSGVADTPDGFLILTRGGWLPPWVEIKGTGHSIPWDTLIDGLRAIASNPAEIRH